METRSVATVIGGSGFLGRYIVKRLAAAGHIVRVAVRDPETRNVPQVRWAGWARWCRSTPTSLPMPRWRRAIEGRGDRGQPGGHPRRADAAATSPRLQAEGAGRVARLSAAELGVKQLVQISAIGAEPGQQGSQYARSKAEGETLVRDGVSPHAVVLRPSLVFGPEDQFFNRFAALAHDQPDHAGDRRAPAGSSRSMWGMWRTR